jgi:hypothetical protein
VSFKGHKKIANFIANSDFVFTIHDFLITKSKTVIGKQKVENVAISLLGASYIIWEFSGVTRSENDEAFRGSHQNF